MVDRIYRRAAGQPLFTEQLVAHAGDDQPLPDVLADLLDGRLDGLSGPAWSVARALGIAHRPLTHLKLRDVTTLTADDLTLQLPRPRPASAAGILDAWTRCPTATPAARRGGAAPARRR